jgi:hypothetical protein
MTEVFITMNTPKDRSKLFKIIQMLYGLMGLRFSKESALMGSDEDVLEYFIFSFLCDFGEVIKDYIAANKKNKKRTRRQAPVPIKLQAVFVPHSKYTQK